MAEVPDGPPARFRWRRVLHEVAIAEGPERIAMEWWRDATGQASDARLLPRRKPRGPAGLALPRRPSTAAKPRSRAGSSTGCSGDGGGFGTRPWPDMPSLPSPPISRSCAEPPTGKNWCFKRKQLGLAGLGVADRNSVAGVVRAHQAAKETGLPFAPGARLVFCDGTPDILAYPESRSGWGRLTQLLTLGKRRAEKGQCLLSRDDLLAHAAGLNLVVMPGRLKRAAATETRKACRRFSRRLLAALREAAPRVWLGASMRYRGDDARRLARLAAIADAARVPPLATGDVLYHAPERRPLQDVMTCIRAHVTLANAGRRLEANAERHLKPPQEMARLFRDAPDAVAQTLHLLERCRFSLDELEYEYPDETREGYATPQEALIAAAEEGARRRYPDGIPEKVRKALDHEFALIAKLGYAPYFLTVHHIVRFARSQDILCQGRGSAANSTVCYCLGITEVDPARADLLFERFVSADRGEPPDIDVDFEHERREVGDPAHLCSAMAAIAPASPPP